MVIERVSNIIGLLPDLTEGITILSDTKGTINMFRGLRVIYQHPGCDPMLFHVTGSFNFAVMQLHESLIVIYHKR